MQNQIEGNRSHLYKEREDVKSDSQNKRKNYYHTLRKKNRNRDVVTKRKKSNEFIEGHDMMALLEDGDVMRDYEILNECYKFVMSSDEEMRTKGAMMIRRIISRGENPPTQFVIDMGLVPVFISFLGSENLRLVFESAWILTNIACGSSEHVSILVQNGAVGPLRDVVVNCPAEGVKEQAIWCLGNIGGDNVEFRNIVLASGIVSYLVELINESDKPNVISNCTWTISNLCRGKPIPEWGQIYTVLDMMHKVLNSKNPSLIGEALWTLSIISEYHIQAVLDKQLCPLVVEFMKEKNYTIQVPVIRIIGNIATGENYQTQELLNNNILPPLKTLLGSPLKHLVKESCWTVSNLSAGTGEHIQQIIDSGIYQMLIKMLPHSDWEIQKEIVWSLANASSAPIEQATFLINIGAIGALISMMTKPDPNVTKSILEGLLRFLSKDWGDDNRAAYHIEQAGGIDYLEDLQTHESPIIWTLSNTILEQHFNVEFDTPPQHNFLQQQQNYRF